MSAIHRLPLCQSGRSTVCHSDLLTTLIHPTGSDSRHPSHDLVLHPSIRSTRSGRGRSSGRSSGTVSGASGSTVRSSRSVEVVVHLRIELIGSLGLGTTGVATTSTSSAATSVATTSTVGGGAGGDCLGVGGRLGLVLLVGTAGRSSAAAVIDKTLDLTYATRSLRALTGAGTGAREASRTTSIFRGRLSTRTPFKCLSALVAPSARPKTTVAIPREVPLGP